MTGDRDRPSCAGADCRQKACWSEGGDEAAQAGEGQGTEEGDGAGHNVFDVGDCSGQTLSDVCVRKG